MAALTPFLVYEVTKAMIAPLLERNPDLLRALEGAASRAQALLERTIAAQACPSIVLRSHLSDRIRAFFSVKDNVREPPVSKLHRPFAASRVAIDPTFKPEDRAGP